MFSYYFRDDDSELLDGLDSRARGVLLFLEIQLRSGILFVDLKACFSLLSRLVHNF